MHCSKPIIALLTVLVVLTSIKSTYGYSRITSVDLYAPYQGKINEEIPLQADVYTGNNRVEYVHNVQVALLLPLGVKVLSGVNPVNIGNMGPGPSYARCIWTVEFEEPGEHLLMVNASCLDTQYIPQWMNASTTIRIYAPPHVEFEFAPKTSVHVNDTVTFNATKSYARGPNSALVAYAWDFGDETQTTSSEPVIEHKFSGIGNFTVSLNITDNQELFSVNTTRITINLFGDLNCDGQINILDIAIVGKAFGSKPGQPNWNPVADLNNDEIVNILDVALTATQYGKTI